jgi:hypothetical protein
MRKLVLAAVAATMVSGGASAANMGASVNYGLGGLGVDLGVAVMPDFVNLRAGLNGGLDMSGTTTPDQIKYDYSLNTGYKTLGADWHPFGGSFRLSAGYAWSDIALDVAATPATNTAFGGGTLPANTTVNGQTKYGNAPYLSLGWGNHAPRNGGLFFNTELGVMFTGKPDVNLNDATLVAAGLTQTQINAEKDKIKNDAIDFFPIVKLGLGYTF